MVNQDHLAILKQGVEVWNEWREKYPDLKPDLNHADLNKANLSKANLHHAILTEADLNKAILSEAFLHHADLNKANLSEAILSEAILNKANLSKANLYHAILTEADLNKAILSEAFLHHADLSKANLYHAILSEADLSKAILSEAFLHHADLSKANLSGADLFDTDLSGANLSGAILDYTNLSGANLSRAILSGANLSGANLNDAEVFNIKYLDREPNQNTSRWKRFLTWLYPRSIMRGNYQGIRVASCYGNATFKRDAEDQDFLDTLENQWEGTWRIWLFRAWGIIDYGRSMLAVFVIAFLIVVGFGAIYLIPGIISYAKNHNTLFSPFYFSIVTFTTLGFGDVTPKGGIGEIIVSLQVIFGYLTLGLLISILANKVARRS